MVLNETKTAAVAKKSFAANEAKLRKLVGKTPFSENTSFGKFSFDPSIEGFRTKGGVTIFVNGKVEVRTRQGILKKGDPQATKILGQLVQKVENKLSQKRPPKKRKRKQQSVFSAVKPGSQERVEEKLQLLFSKMYEKAREGNFLIGGFFCDEKRENVEEGPVLILSQLDEEGEKKEAFLVLKECCDPVVTRRDGKTLKGIEAVKKLEQLVLALEKREEISLT